MRTPGTGRAFFPMFAPSAYFHSFWISALPAAVVPMTDWWHPMHVFTAGMPTSAERVAVFWQEREVGPRAPFLSVGAGFGGGGPLRRVRARAPVKVMRTYRVLPP